MAFNTINAKAETIATSPAYREAMKRRRCLVPADWFYEWKKLDEKTKHLIYISLKAAEGDAMPVRFHAPMAKRLGATRAEVRDAVLMTLTTAGLRGVMTCLQVALEAWDGG